ncbi:MAG: hypothetical protein GF364_04080 [Candidatus Lokiarchaeota archaeon]|nr:hypothetical protein [Candidatus Lokiarchaeota archaeon]
MTNMIIGLFLSLFLSSCLTLVDIYDSRLTINNNTESAIYVSSADMYTDSKYLTTDSSIIFDRDSNYVYINYNIGNSPEEYKIGARESKPYTVTQGTWELLEKRGDTIPFYFFDAEVIESLPWDSIKNNYLILDRYDLTFSELDSASWIITFPKD